MKPKRSHALVATLLCSVFALSACKKASVQEVSNSQSDVMRVIAPDSLQAQLQITAVASQEVSDMLRVAGQIDFDEQALTRIGSSVTGRVTQIQATLGQIVDKGDTLALINSSELSGAQLSYLKARSERELHRRNMARAKTLFEADVISAAEFQRRESEFEIASAETRAAQDQLRVLGVSPKSIGGQRIAASELEPFASAGDREHEAACHDRPQHLGNDIGHQVGARETATGPETEAHGRIDVTTGNPADGVSHRQQR